MNITSQNLPEFVRKMDELGGPGAPAAELYASGFTYTPAARVDVSLDPADPQYAAQMLALYEEISGRQLDQRTTELTPLNADVLVDAESPYAFQPPSQRAMHCIRIARAIQHADLAIGAKVLDMGCGWGASSELLAQLGFKVHAIDINPSFVDLVQRRAKRLGLNITARESTFEDACSGHGEYDAVFFYECFHHAVNPSAVLAGVSASLSSNGKVIFAGEPIQSIWWPQWGLRLDALSVYCIHKFGWFESGWSEAYLSRILADNDLVPLFSEDFDPVIGRHVLGNKCWTLETREWGRVLKETDWWIEGEMAVSNRSGSRLSSMALHKPRSAKRVLFELWNFSPKAQEVSISMASSVSHFTLSTGRNDIVIRCESAVAALNCEFMCTPWSPAEVLGNGDSRMLGFHLKQIVYSV